MGYLEIALMHIIIIFVVLQLGLYIHSLMYRIICRNDNSAIIARHLSWMRMEFGSVMIASVKRKKLVK
jgi:hypothetical protein